MAVHSDDRIKRDAFLYLDPTGDNQNEFAQCNTCMQWITDARCIIHSESVNVPGSASCGFYLYGTPNGPDAGCYGIITPEESGLVDRPVRCENCRWYEIDDGGECKLFDILNMYHPQLFDLDISVDAKGCCNANQAKET